jgi:NitT/TauT family transport system substrate-binding protein
MNMKAYLAAAIVAVSSLSTLSGAAQAQELEKSSLEVAVGGKALLGYLPLTIAERKGYFQDQGLKVNISDFQGGAKALQALVGGSADVVSGAYEHTILSAARGFPLTAIALQNNSFGVIIALPPDAAAAYKGPEDLKGKIFGVTAPGSSSAAAVQVLLAKAGLTIDDVSIVGVGGGAGAVAAMESGQINAISNFDPVIAILERDHKVTPVVDTRNEAGLNDLYGGAFAGSAFYVATSFAKENPHTTQAFVNAVVEALTWMKNATTDEIVDAVPEEYYGGDKDLYHAIVEKNRGMFSPNGLISEQASANVFRTVSATNPDLSMDNIDISKTYDNSFVEAALKGEASN